MNREFRKEAAILFVYTHLEGIFIRTLFYFYDSRQDFNHLKMTSDVSHLTSVFPLLVDSLFMSSSLAVILIDWNHSFLERSLLRLILSYLPRWRYRNIRQDVYICLVILALGVIYMKKLSFDLEFGRIIFVAVVVLLSFWLQSKTREENVSDKCIGTSKIQVSDKSVQGESLVTRDQEVSEAGIPESLLSLLPSSSEPQSEVDVEEEMRQEYVKDFRKKFDEEIVPEEKLLTAIKYLNTRRGGIAAHRDFDKLMHAVDHIDKFTLSSRLDDSGFPQDYSYDELRHIMVEEKKYRPEEFWRVLEICLETSGFLPSPEEFEEIRNETKVELEEEVEEARQEVEEVRQEVEETHQALERSMRVVEETTQEVVESHQKYRSLKQRLQQRDQALQQKDQVLQQHQQALQQHQQALQQHQEALQQKDRMLEQKDRIIQQERQRVRELEQNPEGELKRRLREMEEEIRRLSAKSNRAVCKICRVEEVQVVFSPCNHSVSCEGCVPSLKEKCPMCRETIQGTVEMILA